MRFALFKNGGMAEWLKASRLKRDSRRSWDVGSATLQGEAERAKRASASNSFVVDEKRFVSLRGEA
jgi:hypothetical protein